MMYKGSIDCAVQILKNEGFMSFMKGAGANILRGVAGAGVLSGFDELQGYYIKTMYPVRTRKCDSLFGSLAQTFDVCTLL